MKKFFGACLFLCLLYLIPPAGAEEITPLHNWRMATSWPGGKIFEQAENWARRVEQMTEGRIKVQVFPGGALGNPLKVPETVKNGVAQAGHTWIAYDWGKDKTAILLSGWPGGMDGEQTLHWLYEAGGEKLFQEFRAERFKVKSFVAGVSTPEIFLHSKKPVHNLSDLNGLKLRAAGAWLELSKDLGAAPVTASGQEVYQMLERNQIDATEWATPGVNLPMGLHQIAEYIILPGWHQPVEVFDVVINERAWETLTDQDKLMVELASKLATFEYWTRNGDEDLKAMAAYKSHGNTIIRMEDTVGGEIRKIANGWADREAAGNEWFAKVLQSQRDFMAAWAANESTRRVQ